MTSDVFLYNLAESCRAVINDAVSGISVCTTYEDATLIGFMQLHRLCGVRLLMLSLSVPLGVDREAEKIFDLYFTQLEDIKAGSRSLLTGANRGQSKKARSATPAPPVTIARMLVGA